MSQLYELTLQDPPDPEHRVVRDGEEQVSIILHSVAPRVLQVTDAIIEAKI